jgi:hypothetical protein
VDEVLQHLFRDGEIGDDAVFQWPDGGDVARRAAQHELGLGTDRGNALRAAGTPVLADGDHRRFVQDDPLAADVDQRVGRAEIDGEIVGEQAKETFYYHLILVREGGSQSKGGNLTTGRGLGKEFTPNPSCNPALDCATFAPL